MVMQKISQRILLSLTLVVCYTMIGCGASFIDVTEELQNKQVITILSGENGSPVWLEEDLIAFEHGPAEKDNDYWDFRIIIFTVSTGEWYELPLPPHHDECSVTAPTSIGNLTKLPNGNLGFIFECDLKSSIPKPMLYMWDKETNSLKMLYEYPAYFDPTWYAFAPDMTEFIQATGASTEDKLYRISQNGDMIQTLLDFQRANRPSWSSDSKTVAFMGTKTYPGGDPDEYPTYEEFRKLLLHPWDIYLMDASGSNVRLILSGIEEPGDIQWVPGNDRLLSFRGDYQDTPGIWVLDIETRQVTRIWSYRSGYSWSPDGKRMVVFELKEENGVEHRYPVIIDVPINGE